MQKYKVFLNEKRIIFKYSPNITLTKATTNFIKAAETQRVSGWISNILENQNDKTVLEHPDPEKILNLFRNVLLEVNAAGGVVKRNNELLFIFRNKKWDLPKGKIEKKETPQQAALREVSEECGIKNIKIKKPLPSTFHIYKSPYKKTLGQWIFKETFWFEMEYNGVENGHPQLEEDITEVQWFKHKDLSNVLENTYENLKSLINCYFD